MTNPELRINDPDTWYGDHPLTDEIIEDILLNRYWWELEPCQDSLRDAADWQLEQVIEWIKENLTSYEEYFGCAVIDEWRIISDLKKAMRPQMREEMDG